MSERGDLNLSGIILKRIDLMWSTNPLYFSSLLEPGRESKLIEELEQSLVNILRSDLERGQLYKKHLRVLIVPLIKVLTGKWSLPHGSSSVLERHQGAKAAEEIDRSIVELLWPGRGTRVRFLLFKTVRSNWSRALARDLPVPSS